MRLNNGTVVFPPTEKIAIVDDVDASQEAALTAKGFQTERIKNSKNPEELAQRLAGFDGVITRTSSDVSRAVLEAVREHLAVVQGACKGPHVDLKAAEEMGIQVLKVDSNREQVVRVVQTAMMNAANGFAHGHNSLAAGHWEKSEVGKTMFDLSGSTLGIIGYGNIGQLLAEQTRDLVGRRVAVNHRFERHREYDDTLTEHASKWGVDLSESMESALRAANILSLHVDTTDAHGNKNDGLITTDLLRAWSALHRDPSRPPVFINIARASVAPSLEDLNTLLHEGVLHSAFVDAHPKGMETKTGWEMPGNPHSGLMVTPHIGGSGAHVTRQTSIDVAEVLHKWTTTGAFADTSRVYPHEVLRTKNLVTSSPIVVALARDTQQGSAEAVQHAIRRAGLTFLGGEAFQDGIPGSKSARRTVVPHIVGLENGSDFERSAQELAKELDVTRHVRSIRFIPTAPEQAEILNRLWRK